VRLRENRNVNFKLLKVDLDAARRAEVRDAQIK